MKIEALLRIVLVTVVVIFCSAVAKAQPPETWSKNAVIYEVNVRQYTVEGTFKAFANHLPQLKELGVDILWFMPIYPISQESRKGSLGSYYSVKDYKGVNPEFGNVKDFKVLVRKAHEMGFKVILDWVANHTGRDNVWMTEHPDWYVKDAQGKALAPFDWTDAAKLDYKNAEMRAAMQDAMSYWVKEVGVDGFRCDVAGEVPTDFWNDTRAKLDRIKPVFMLAEADKPELTKKAFHADYNWPLLNVMNDIAKGKKTATDIDKVLAHHDSVFAPASFKMNFVTNHDENSWSGSEYERLGAGVKAFVVLTYTYPGIPLIYTGQEAGLKKRLSFFEKDTVANWKTPVLFGFYKKMNRLKHTQPALSVGKTRGVFIRYATDNPLLYIFERRVKGNKVLVVLNLSDKVLVVKFTKEKPSGIFTDYFGNVKADASRIDGITLSPWKYFIYTNITK
jgi:glycosidase